MREIISRIDVLFCLHDEDPTRLPLHDDELVQSYTRILRICFEKGGDPNVDGFYVVVVLVVAMSSSFVINNTVSY